MQVQSVGIASISYDEESTKLINMRNQGAMLGDPTVREGYVQELSPVVWRLRLQRQRQHGGFMGMGVGMNAGGGFRGAASASNQQQMQAQQAAGAVRPEPVSAAASANEWLCVCGAKNNGNFCASCGKPGLRNLNGFVPAAKRTAGISVSPAVNRGRKK